MYQKEHGTIKQTQKIANNEQDATEKFFVFGLVPLNITSFMNFLSDMSMFLPIHIKIIRLNFDGVYTQFEILKIISLVLNSMIKPFLEPKHVCI